MTRLTARVPLRADLAGGTLDLWPLYLFHPGARTVNVAISIYAECEVQTTNDSAIDVTLTDASIHRRYSSLDELLADEGMALIGKTLEYFNLGGLQIVTRTEAPRGSGLGGSSALAVALVRSFSALAGAPVDGDDLIALVRDIETRLLGVPAGVQDYYPPVYGGLAALHLDPGRIVRHPLTIPLADLERHFVLHYSGVAHFSGTNNWEMYKRQVERDPRVNDGLSEIAAIANRMEKALEAQDLEAAGQALGAEWAARKKLVDGISTPEVDRVIELGIAAGAWGGKVCGAGGGGCIVFLAPPDRREAVVQALANAPGRVLPVGPVSGGITVEEVRDQMIFSFGHRRGISGQDLDELWVASSEKGVYKPFVLAEAAITFDHPRFGVHRTINRTLLAPVDLQTGEPRWQESREADPAQMELRPEPEPGRDSIGPRDPDQLRDAVVEGEIALRLQLVESEKISLWHNPAFEIFSQPDEPRADFLQRLMEIAEQKLETESEQLERTFRRRIDQMRERAERDQREVDEAGQDSPRQGERPELGIAWGQTLYNITSGRHAPPSGNNLSPNEADYVEKISQLQKHWDREREVLRDELTQRARSLEEIHLTPSTRGVETRRYMIVWIPSTR